MLDQYYCIKETVDVLEVIETITTLLLGSKAEGNTVTYSNMKYPRGDSTTVSESYTSSRSGYHNTVSKLQHVLYKVRTKCCNNLGFKSSQLFNNSTPTPKIPRGVHGRAYTCFKVLLSKIPNYLTSQQKSQTKAVIILCHSYQMPSTPE